MRKFRKLLVAAMIAAVAAMTSTVPALAQEMWITTADGASRFVTCDENGNILRMSLDGGDQQ